MRIESPYHEGELALQQRVQERAIADRNGRAIADAVVPGALKFFEQQPMLIVGSVDASGHPWASMLTGARGFAMASNEKLIHLDLAHAGSHERDPFFENIRGDARVGILAIEPASRRRYRINGHIRPAGASSFEVEIEEAYPNCPQYIQRRELSSVGSSVAGSAHAFAQGVTLSSAQRAWIERVDTLFVASLHPGRGADASHRGGHAGFVRMPDGHTLRVPDYSGNSMYNTLGNLQVNPWAGLLIVDFHRSRTLQLIGQVTLHFDQPEVTDQPTGGTGRYWDFSVEQWIEAGLKYPLRAEHLDAWPKNPKPLATV